MSELSSDPCMSKVFNDVPHPIGSTASVPCSVNKLGWQKALSVVSGLHPRAAEFWCCHEEPRKSKKIWTHQQKTTFSSWLLALNACVMPGKSQSLPFRCSQLLIVTIATGNAIHTRSINFSANVEDVVRLNAPKGVEIQKVTCTIGNVHPAPWVPCE